MSRIPPNRVGYSSGYTCTGLSYRVPAPIDCTGNQYKKLPMLAFGGNEDIPWQDLEAVTRKLYDLQQLCDFDYDPFTGQFMDLYRFFLDAGMGYLITNACYESSDIFGPGFMSPKANYQFAGVPCDSKD